MFINKLIAQETLVPDHYYIYLKSVDKNSTAQLSFTTEFGKYGSTKKKLSPSIKYNQLDTLLNAINEHEYKGVIFYIHGFQADNKQFEEVTSKFLHDEIFSQLDEKYNLIISLKWTSGMDYPNSVPTALSKGSTFLPMANKIIETLQTKNKDLNVSFLNHSMGNRVFEGLMIEQKKQAITWKLDKVLMFAPDVESNVFFTTLNHLPDQLNKGYIFYNIDDRTLSIAKMLREHKRLGIVGHDDPQNLPSNIIPINTTGLNDNEGLTAKITLHRYFYTSPSIRKKIIELLK
jgi:hypothetical protein